MWRLRDCSWKRKVRSVRPQRGGHVGGDADADCDHGDEERDEEQNGRRADTGRTDTCRRHGNSDVTARPRDARTVVVLLQQSCNTAIVGIGLSRRWVAQYEYTPRCQIHMLSTRLLAPKTGRHSKNRENVTPYSNDARGKTSNHGNRQHVQKPDEDLQICLRTDKHTDTRIYRHAHPNTSLSLYQLSPGQSNYVLDTPDRRNGQNSAELDQLFLKSTKYKLPSL